MSSHQWLTELHIKQARLYALRLIAFSGSVFPCEWGDQWAEAIVPDLLEFGFHARKVNEFCGLNDSHFPSINELTNVNAKGDPGNWEVNYRKALNALLHVKSFTIGHAHAEHRKIYLNSTANLITTYITVETDKFAESTISLSGLAHCFLTHVISKIKSSGRELNF